MSATLQDIRTKVRRLTRSLSEDQLSTAQIDDYINTFVLYDFPEHLRLFNLRETFSFYTEPYVDVYETSSDPNSVLYNFKNKYLTIHPPIYIAGYQVWFSESRDQFFSAYPLVNSIASIGTTGNGATTKFTGVINSQQANTSGISGQTICLLRNNVLFSSIDANNNGLSMIDFPINSTFGNLYVPGTAPTSTTILDPNNYINYITGQFVVTFATPPGAGQVINSQTRPMQPAIPQAMLFYDGKFTLRPIPDQPYKVDMEVYVRPTELLASNQEPKLQEWASYISYGAAIKVFQDRMDLESVSMVMPEYKNQERLILRRTIVQQTSQRTSTIYSENLNPSGAYGPGWFNGGGSL